MNKYNISLFEQMIISITYGIHKLRPYSFWRVFSTALLIMFDNKFPDCRMSRYFAKRYFNIEVGKYSYGFTQFLTENIKLESIGAFCSIARATITGVNHPLNRITTHPSTYRSQYNFVEPDLTDEQVNLENNKKVVIGNDVWIGTNATILPSVVIHDGAVIAAGSVVNKNVEPYSIVGGVPAKLIRYRFDEDTRNMLTKLKWWMMDDVKIKKLFSDLGYGTPKNLNNYPEEELKLVLKKYLDEMKK